VYFTQSTDGGTTWSAPLRINDDSTTNDQWQPVITVTPDGTHLFMAWYDRRNDPNNKHIDWYGVTAGVSGSTITWGANFAINDQWFPVSVNKDPVIAINYMGDYDQATATNSYFITTWGDNRDGNSFCNHQPDVRFSAIPVTMSGGPHIVRQDGDGALAALLGVDGGVVPLVRPFGNQVLVPWGGGLLDGDVFHGPDWAQDPLHLQLLDAYWQAEFQ
jgi:hypothetical protein